MEDELYIDIQFSPKNIKSFRVAYNKAVKADKDQFTWDRHEFITSYAKYVLEYLDNQRTQRKTT